MKAEEFTKVLRSIIGERPVIFAGKCQLCGSPSRRNLLCHACSWAYGDEEYDRGSQHTLEGGTAASRRQEGTG